MDIYLEHLIKQKHSLKSVLIIILLYVIAFILSLGVLFFALSSPILMQFTLPISVGLFFGAWWLSTNFMVEYEYIITNDELDVDKIIAKRRRKRLLTVSVKDFEIMEKAEGNNFESSKKSGDIAIKLDASIGKDSINRYYAIFINKHGQRMLLIFNPTREMLNTIKKYNPMRVKIDD